MNCKIFDGTKKIVSFCFTRMFARFRKFLLPNVDAQSTEKRDAEIKYVKEASLKLKLLLNQSSDKELQRLIEKAYNLIYNSQTKSSIEVCAIERIVLNEILVLEKFVENKDYENVEITVNKICNWALQRNHLLKLLN